MRNGFRIFLGSLWLGAALVSQAAAAETAPHARLELIPERKQLAAGEFRVAVRFQIEKGWHLYWKNPGDSGLAPSFEWDLPRGVRLREILWPYPEKIEDASGTTYGYRDEAVLIALFEAAPKLSEAAITVKAKWIACEKTCVPEKGTARAVLSVKAPAAPPEALFLEAEKRIPYRNPYWLLSALIDDRTLSLVLYSPEGAAVPPGLRFFPEDPELLDPGAAQTVTGSKGSVELAVPLSAAAKIPQRLKGAVVADAAWNEWDARRALEIDTPLRLNPKKGT
ncbi:MAG TPA: protein-disulfide reductase DsbD domain-containing protein [Candidatus Eisenbacteria bacterium]|nr:protein-disulfide reductase DsbD domain-containing protein [Candidatus Eisenbacteria bacterium]